MAAFHFKITEPKRQPIFVTIGPHETAFMAKRAVQHSYPDGTVFESVAEIPAPTPVIEDEEVPPVVVTDQSVIDERTNQTVS